MEKMLQLQGKIQSLDPLGADAIFAHLPTYNTMRNIQGLIDVTRTIKQVSPQIFAHQLRVFWEPVEIGGVKYDGAGAAQLPVCIIDHFFWASDRGDSLYKSYSAHTLQYVACELRQLYEAHATRPSLTTQLGAALAHRVSFTPLEHRNELFERFSTLDRH